METRTRGRKKNSKGLYPHSITYRASDSMMQKIADDIASNRKFGIMTKTDVIEAALKSRYNEENLWDAITRRLDRQKRELESIDVRFARIEEMLLLFFEYYFIQYPVFDDQEKDVARLKGRASFANYTKALEKRLLSSEFVLKGIKNAKGGEKNAV